MVEKPIEKVATAVLSTTAKAKARERTKEKEKAATSGEAMETVSFCPLFGAYATYSRSCMLSKDKPSKSVDDIEMKPIDENEASTANASEAADDATTTGAAPKVLRKSSEPTSEVLHNFARVTPKQLAHVVFPPENRFQPVRAVAQRQTSSSSSASGEKKPARGRYAGGGGVIVLVDTRPGDGEPEWVQSLADQAAAAAAAEPTIDIAAASSGPVPILEDDVSVEPPPPFEVSDLPSVHR